MLLMILRTMVHQRVVSVESMEDLKETADSLFVFLDHFQSRSLPGSFIVD